MHGGLNINSVPDLAKVEIDIRTIPGQSNDALCEEIGDLLGRDAEVSRIVDVGAVASSPENPWIESVFAICERTTRRAAVAPRGATYFTDASVLVPAMGHIPALILGPGETSMAHKTDEYCLVTKIEGAVELYTEIATGLDGELSFHQGRHSRESRESRASCGKESGFPGGPICFCRESAGIPPSGS